MKTNNINYRQEYICRINRVIDYIEDNLSQDLSLNKLAKVACFSPYHFHRIFSSMIGESLNQFITRLRMEKAATLVVTNFTRPISQIMFDCGYSDPSSFARAFKKYMGMSATQWRKKNKRKISQNNNKFNQELSKARKALKKSSCYIRADIINQKWSMKMNTRNDLKAVVEVKEIESMPVAYIRHIGPYQADPDLFQNLYEKLFKWAAARDLLNFPETQTLTVYHDDPEITDEEKLRMSVCITIPEDTQVSGEIGKMKIPGGKYAFANFRLDSTQFGAAWNMVCKEWLPESGYQFDDRPSFEMCHNNPAKDPENKFDVDIVIPLKPLV